MVRHSNQNSQAAGNRKTLTSTAQTARAQAESIALARGRQSCYLLLSRLYEREVDHQLWQALLDGELREVGETLGFKLLSTAKPVDEVLEALAVDYCQLFIGPGGHRPAYQSIWD